MAIALSFQNRVSTHPAGGFGKSRYQQALDARCNVHLRPHTLTSSQAPTCIIVAVAWWVLTLTAWCSTPTFAGSRGWSEDTRQWLCPLGSVPLDKTGNKRSLIVSGRWNQDSRSAVLGRRIHEKDPVVMDFGLKDGTWLAGPDIGPVYLDRRPSGA